MKKIYSLSLAVLATSLAFGQANLSFETWTAGNPASWNTTNLLSQFGTLSDIPVTEGTTDPSDGNSYFVGESVTLSGATTPQQFPNGVYGGTAFQSWNTTNAYQNISFDIKYEILTGDKGALVINGFNANGDLQAVGLELLEGTQATWTTVTVDINFLNSDIAEWTVFISSSAASVLGPQANPGVPAEGSKLEVDNIVLGPITPVVPFPTNVVASDISDNGNGTDLQVTFNVPSDESNITTYWVVACATGFEPGFVQDPLTLVSNAGIQVTPNGNNKTVNFSASDIYLGVSGNNVVPNPIVENVSMTVYVYVVGATGYLNGYVGSNEITLSSVASIDENELLINAFPNPTSDVLNISISEDASSVSVISMDGKIVTRQEVNGNSTSIDVAGLNSGIYFYEVVTKGGSIVRNSFMKN